MTSTNMETANLIFLIFLGVVMILLEVGTLTVKQGYT